MSNQISYNSEFLPDVEIVVILSDHPKYDELKPLFDEYGYGFMVPNKNLIIIDGEQVMENNFNSDVLKFIEAHEVSHIILGHNTLRNEDDELDADLGAYLLLKKTGKDNSIDVLIDNFKDRHGIDFNLDLLDRIKNSF